MENLVKNEAYTHYNDVEGYNVTFAMAPTKDHGIMIRTKMTRKKISGETVRVERIFHVVNTPLSSAIYGPVEDVKTYFTSERRAEKMLPSWASRSLSDHIRHFYS